jgi:hypothetical protein
VKLGSGHDRIGLLLFHWPGRLGRWPLSSDRFLVLLYGLLFCAPLAAFLAVLRQRDHPDAVQPRDNATPRAAEGLRSVITGITTRFDAMSTRQAQPPALQQDDEHAAPEPAQHHQRWIRPVLAMSLLLLLVVALYLQSNIGSADNGDFGRVMTIVTPGPVGFSVNWPATGTEEYKKRFFAYWLPYWKLDFSVASTMRSSVQLLWLPGALLNYAFVSPAILYLSNIGLLPKLLLIMFLFLALKWIDQGGMTRSRQALLYLTLGTPLLLIFSNTNYVADMNSFYQEPASFVFLLAFLASLLVLWRRRAPWSYALSLVCLMLLATAKPGNVYWPIIGVAFMVEWRKLFSSRAWRVLLVFACTLGMVLLAFIITRYPPQYRRCTAYNRLFYGVLTFSSDPARRMAELGIADGMRCIEGPIFNAIGEQCAQEYGSKMTFLNTALVVLREPAIFGRITADLANHMQDTNVSFVGRVASGDPGAARTGLLNAWSALKLRLFPRGWLFFAALGGYALLFARTLRASGMLREFALIGLLTTLAVIIDMYVAMFGDGIATLVRHLYLTNILFDIATIAALNIVVLHAPTMVDALRSMRLRQLA